MKQLTLCADDFGFSPQISEGILKLAGEGRIHAISCMTGGQSWQDFAPRLRSLSPRVQIGLHLNFTEPLDPESPVWGLNALIIRCWSRCVPPTLIRQAIQRQWTQFRDVTGRDPDFIDGHQHVHQFPVIRTQLLAELQARHFRGWLRSLGHIRTGGIAPLKATILSVLGGNAFDKICRQTSTPCNPGFAGIYDFNPQADYRMLMKAWLEDSVPHGLIMCHPAYGNAGDAIAAARQKEFDYLRSSAFAEDCLSHDILTGPWSHGNRNV